jgi:uncharacterized membrane protein YidH (DUF202 family)
LSHPDSATPPADAGLARERTILAWNRSGLAAVVCIVVLLRRLWPLYGAAQRLALGLIGVAAILWALVLLAVATAGGQDGQPVMGHRVFPLMTAGTLLLAVVGFVLAFVAPP